MKKDVIVGKSTDKKNIAELIEILRRFRDGIVFGEQINEFVLEKDTVQYNDCIKYELKSK